MSSLISPEITSRKVCRHWIPLFYSPQSHLISCLLIFSFAQVTRKDLKYHLNDSFPWLLEFSQRLADGPEKTKALHNSSTGKGKQNKFYASFGMQSSPGPRPKPQGWNKTVPLENMGQPMRGFGRTMESWCSRKDSSPIFCFAIHQQLKNQVRGEEKHLAWEVGAARGGPQKVADLHPWVVHRW